MSSQPVLKKVHERLRSTPALSRFKDTDREFAQHFGMNRLMRGTSWVTDHVHVVLFAGEMELGVLFDFVEQRHEVVIADLVANRNPQPNDEADKEPVLN